METGNRINPTVILQDLVMPGVDGLTLLSQYRSHPGTRDIPIIVLSTNDNPQMKAQAFVNQTLVAEGELMAAVGQGEA